MKLKLFIFFILVCCGSIYLIQAQSTRPSVPKVEKVDISVSELIIKDSLFLSRLDSLIFNSICPDIKRPNEKAKVFNIFSKQRDKTVENYEFIFRLEYGIQVYDNKPQGCFEYRGYLFLWFDDISKELLSISTKKRKLTYISGVPLRSELATFVFNYSNEGLVLTGICCY
jgi:hypothetical protein